jgi:hypothetical protein
MKRLGFAALAATLTLAASCTKRSPEASGTAGSGSAAATAPATGSAEAPAAGGSAAAAAGSGAAGSDTAAAGAGSGSAAGSGAAVAGTQTGADTAATSAANPVTPGGMLGVPGHGHHAGMCPSTVQGATTTAAVKGKAVVVSVESADKDAIAAIQKRTDKLLAEKKTGPTNGAGHDQKGTHGGVQGLCPVFVPDGAAATAKHGAKGVVVTITPKESPDDLAKEIDGRIAKTNDWVKANVKDADKGNQGGVGGGKGEDGSNHSGKGDGKGHERKQTPGKPG